jgi:hypothetical protein
LATAKENMLPVILFSVAVDYNYDKGYTPTFKDQSLFEGQIIRNTGQKNWLLTLKRSNHREQLR